jgi:hypothetical protein
LADAFEGPVEDAAEDDDYTSLDDEHYYRVLLVVVRWVAMFENAALWHRSSC